MDFWQNTVIYEEKLTSYRHAYALRDTLNVPTDTALPR